MNICKYVPVLFVEVFSFFGPANEASWKDAKNKLLVENMECVNIFV